MEINERAKRLLLGQRCINCRYWTVQSDRQKIDYMCLIGAYDEEYVKENGSEMGRNGYELYADPPSDGTNDGPPGPYTYVMNDHMKSLMEKGEVWDEEDEAMCEWFEE